ncbi:MAG: DUF3467 domain-containing protein [Lachnospiraceae bacterium]|nr:DUF3467 domain-containing protein [Lachnospiraceae bacterium]
MDTNNTINTIYANGFRIAFSQLESQILFKLETPVFDETNNIAGATEVDVSDIRLHPALAKELYTKLGEQIDIYETNFGKIKPLEGNN